MNEKTLAIFFMERVGNFASKFISSFGNVPGRALPYIYKMKEN
jgi:hypothetical protein